MEICSTKKTDQADDITVYDAPLKRHRPAFEVGLVQLWAALISATWYLRWTQTFRLPLILPACVFTWCFHSLLSLLFNQYHWNDKNMCLLFHFIYCKFPAKMQIPFPLYVSHSPRQSIPQLTLGKDQRGRWGFCEVNIFLSILVFHLHIILTLQKYWKSLRGFCGIVSLIHVFISLE